MANRYTNRGVTPSYLESRFMGGTSRSPMQDETFQLLMGEVKEIIPASSPKSLSRKYLEYNVEVQYREAGGPTSLVTFSNCLLINSLAGVADKNHFTLRSDKRAPDVDQTNTTGAKVLLLCIQGNAGQAFIIGGVREDAGGDKADHHYFFEFNGAQATINKDGELQIRYRGATKVDGKLADSANADAEGSTVIFNKDGGIKLYTKDEKQFIFLNHKDKKLEILADEEWNVKVNKKLIFEAGDDISVTGKKACSIEIKDNITVLSSGVLVGAATDYWLLANAYRAGETAMMQKLSGLLKTIQSQMQTAGASLAAAAGANSSSGSSAVTPFNMAAAALNACGPLFAQMADAVDTFESGADSYLSKKNKND